MKQVATYFINATIPVFKTGDYVQLTRAQDRHFPVGTTAMVNERFTDGIDFRRDAYVVTFDNNSDIIRIEDLTPAKTSESPFNSSKDGEKKHAQANQKPFMPPPIKRPLEKENGLLADSGAKKAKRST